jgi:hypothetical protein
VGGYTALGGDTEIGSKGQVGYIVDYNASTDAFSDFTELSLNNDRTLFTHIEGIDAYLDGFSLAAMAVHEGTLQAAYAYIERTTSGFGTPVWQSIVTDSAFSTGDTVIDTSVMGLYQTSSGASASFVYTDGVSIPEPSTVSLIVFGLGGWVMMRRNRS